MSSWAPTKYKTTNWSAYNDALRQRGSLTIWFDPDMVWRPPPTGKRGRQPSFSDAAIQTCLTMKVLFGMPLRQTTGFVESLLRLVGLDWRVPDFSTLCRRQRTLNVAIPYRGGTGPLDLLIDSTGIKAEGEGEWNARKHGGPKRRIWRKIHIGIDEQTLEVRAVEITGSNIGDAPMLPELLDQIPPDQDVGSVTADGAYDTRKCHDAIAARGAHAVIPPRKNAKPWKPTSTGAIARNEAVRASRYLGKTLWRRWSGYHRRSRVEAKMNCIKLLGQSLMARDFDRQVAELQVRIAVLNGYTALGIPITEAVG
ncbi:IS5 family transposase [Sulfitobacter pseudonitzschiae]|uniref:IS5 family transposase n=1 Tax=Pseudosulfitobacter pseudonitzschiae TaxID=1402135 RepID=A0A9Q2RV95_9RHOB|nr:MULTISPECIES: IS5 family transposase [Pseudosulfitobacter]MBM2295184.1 IS5 family transposase [Pseudosulfitobacter pseudonitzschiae]MBM2300095.1 IS5 family transposase [Pseudosulfitobacter pseudonitzschiae]MBM2305016.1 IS5 family transposase [Pseudosulfitobacter pseudonitzschiae]MBM2314793.1 IS5 family transposase [Pseudosulfitobacter pseudonitzschiae]MBM2319714.1 IS5 family transposase [Pseudosulfitobacter pseudonitzschiae]